MQKVCFIIIFLSFGFNLVKSQTLTIYTDQSFASPFGPAQAIKEKFEPLCQCKVKFIAMEDNLTMFNRLQIEGKKTSADLVLGLDNNLIDEAEKTGLFQPHQIKNSSQTLPISWKNPYFYPYDYGYFSLVYNQDNVKKIPLSMDELLNSKDDWKIVYQDPRTSSVGLGFILWMNYIYQNNIEEAWLKLAKKTLTVTKSWSEAYSLMLKNEADFVVSYTTSPAYHIENQNDHRFNSLNLKEGHYLQIETAGILATTKHYELANQFIQFLTSPEIQTIIITKNAMYPVTTTLVPQSYQALIKPSHSYSFPSEKITQQRKKWIKVWLENISQ